MSLQVAPEGEYQGFRESESVRDEPFLLEPLRQAEIRVPLLTWPSDTRLPRIRQATVAWLCQPNRLSLLLCLLASTGLWLIFYPTVYSRDSFYMLLDATTGKFSDMHPLLIPVFLSGILKLGADVALVTLAQIVLGLLGIRRLVIVLGRFLGADGTKASPWLELAILALLASPLTPLAIYLATIWSDTWLAILLIWIMALLLELRQDATSRPHPRFKIAVLIILLGLLALVRYNAIVIYPFLVVPFVGTLRRHALPASKVLCLAALPMVLAVSFVGIEYRVNNIKRLHPERAVYALDLASMVLRDPSVCRNLSLQSCELILGEFSPGFRVGDGAISLTFNQANEFQYAPFLELTYYPRLEDELFMAVVEHPALFLQVKLLNFLDYVRPDLHQYFFQNNVIAADLRQLPEQVFASPNGPWFGVARQVHWSPVLSWLSYVHEVWLVVGILELVGLGVLARRRRDSETAFVWQLLLAPMAYYFAHFIALTTSEFRFMYPATLVIQVVALTAVASFLARSAQRPPSLATL